MLRWLELLAEFRATQSWAPHFAFGLVAERLEKGEPRGWDLSCIRALNCAGEAIVAGTLRRFLAVLARHGLREDALCPMWGMAETSSTLAVTRGVRTHADEPYVELGAPVAGAALRVVDEQERVVPEGTVGHLQVRGAAVLSGYLEDGALNAQSFTPEGWLRTGDLAVVRDGRMAIAGRQKEVLIINGANVHPHEIEAVVEQVPGVLPSFSAACPTREPGALTDELVVFFVPSPDAPPLGALLRSIREQVGRTLGLAVSHLVPLAEHQVPKTQLGKRGRSELRRRFESGELAAERRGAERLLGGPSTLPRCLAVPRLVPRPQLSPGEPPPAGPLLLLAGAGFATALRERLSGRRVVWVESGPGEAERWARALAEQAAEGARFEEVVYVAGGEERPPRAPREALEEGIAPLLRRVQTLAPLAAQAPLRLQVVVPHAGEGSPPELASLLLPGLLRSAVAEVPGLEARLVWVPPEPERAAECVAAELTGLRRGPEVSWREGVRWERAFTPWQPSRLEAPRHLKPGGCYLVTGALGGLGQAWARYLRQALGARLLLVGRRERDALAEAMERELEAVYASVDLTDGARLREVVRQAESRLGRPLDGAFHFAGTWQAVPLARETARGLVQGAAAHVLGALAVAEAFRDRPEALLVFTSSLMGTLGVEQQASYGAASGFIDRFVEGLAAQGRHAVAVAFSPVRGTGMARTVRAAPPGCRMLEPTQALAALALAVESGRSGVFLAGVEGSAWPWRAVGLGAGEPLEQAHLFFSPDAGGAPPHVEADLPVALHPVASLPRRDDGTVDREALATELAGLLGEGPLSPLEEVVAEAFREVLGASEVGARTDFFALGGSSLQASRVVARLNERLGLRLREVALFEHPSVSRLAAWLQQSVSLDAVDVSLLSDAQVDLLLRVLGPS
jgi:NADP-dependent 3-hydroxy acid dehydrogenase YdfG